MKDSTLDRFVELERDISQKKGGFALFALFARDNLWDHWDLVVAAPWVRDKREGTEYLVGEIQKSMGAAALMQLSRIVFVEPTDPPVQAINTAVRVEHGRAEIRDRDFFGEPVRLAYIITSQSLAPAAR